MLVSMKLTMQLKLLPTDEQSASMLKTMEQFNAACDALAAIAFRKQCANKVELQNSPTTTSGETSDCPRR
jgi:predicted transposase